MRIVLVAADVVMGLILGVFLYAVVSRVWPPAQAPLTLAVVLVASVIVVLFRRPGGSLARRNGSTRP
jgi:uncharacterized membrane protein YccC